MDDDLIAFIDESRKPVRQPGSGKVDDQRSFYVIGVAVVLRADTPHHRDALQAMMRTQKRRGPGALMQRYSGAYFRRTPEGQPASY